jgi:cysteine desulfurase
MRIGKKMEKIFPTETENIITDPSLSPHLSSLNSSSMKDRLYLDGNATTPPFPEVIEKVLFTLPLFGNPSSIHREGRIAHSLVEEAREQTAELFSVPPSRIVFTSGGTESLNALIYGAIERYRGENPPYFFRSKGEHPAVENTVKKLEEKKKIIGIYLPTDPQGRVSPEELSAFLDEFPEKERIAGAVLIAAHNETGYIQDLPTLAELFSRYRIPLILDGVQWSGRIPIDLSRFPFYGWAFSAHKFGGLKGCGGIVTGKEGWNETFLTGGPQEKGRRGGTENVVGIVACGVAAKIAREEMETWRKVWDQERIRWEHFLSTTSLPIRNFSDPAHHLPQTYLLQIPELSGEEIVAFLDMEGIAVSYGSACSSGTIRKNETLLRLGVPPHIVRSLIRVSLPPRAKPGSMETFGKTLQKILKPV